MTTNPIDYNFLKNLNESVGQPERLDEAGKTSIYSLWKKITQTAEKDSRALGAQLVKLMNTHYSELGHWKEEKGMKSYAGTITKGIDLTNFLKGEKLDKNSAAQDIIKVEEVVSITTVRDMKVVY